MIGDQIKVTHPKGAYFARVRDMILIGKSGASETRYLVEVTGPNEHFYRGEALLVNPRDIDSFIKP